MPQLAKPGVFCLPLLWLAACAINPATGERQLSFMSEGQEIEMGIAADPDIVASMGLYPDEELQVYVQDLGARLAGQSERPDLPWTFRVLDDPLINAFALPGGFIYVTRGILAHFESEAELAGVLGHEIGHVTARHSVNQISRAQLAQIGLGVGMILAPELQPFEALANTSMQLLFLRFGRDDERQADQLGVRYMSRLGYDPHQLGGVMAMLGQTSASGGAGQMPEWLSTHPNPDNRGERITGAAEAAEVASDPPLVRREEYLPRLDGMTYGVNPREGYFEESRFLHPDMAFQLDFPEGWRSMNSKRAVQAISPQEDALLALTLGEGAAVVEALSAFLAQDGMQSGNRSTDPINGIPAASADFRFTSQEGVLDGRVVFLEHRGVLLRFIGYGPSQAWSSRRDVVLPSLQSFRPLTDESLLNVEPARLRVVTLGRGMSFSSVLEREGATAYADQARLLNRVQGDPMLPAGRMLKIPMGGIPPETP
jgi:predicted Zn-dependent protease